MFIMLLCVAGGTMINKNGLISTVITYLLTVGMILLILAYVISFQAQNQSRIKSLQGEKIAYLYDDAASNFLKDFFHIGRVEVLRENNLSVIFYSFLLNTSEDISPSLLNYKYFIENNYAQLQHASISLDNLNNSIIIQPYNTTIIKDDSLYFYTLPASTNYLHKISLVLIEPGQFNGSCLQPAANNGAVQVTVTNVSADSNCSTSNYLDPYVNNDLSGSGQEGKQFFQSLSNPYGWAEVKYGLVEGIPGTLLITTSSAVNLSQVILQYQLLPAEQVKIKGGKINIQVGEGSFILQRSDDLVFFQE